METYSWVCPGLIVAKSDELIGVYAWLLGAGTSKVSRILRCSSAQAKQAVESFIQSTKGLSELRHGRIRRDARRGYFEGLDGRKVINSEEYLMLAGYLQAGEAVAMKHANILWDHWAREEKINFRQTNLVHDEFQVEVNDSLDAAERLGELQCMALTKTGESLGLFCPLSGETQIGKSWLDTH
jgi:DNA polymerase I-like protein with 3'-5' exonuclease and polymerase domains